MMPLYVLLLKYSKIEDTTFIVIVHIKTPMD
jgi:hypothetical protein